MSDPTPRTPFAAQVTEWAIDAAAVVGAGLITFGVALIYRPAAFIIAGGFLLASAWLAARKSDA
jgi:hypothetical protein